MIPDFYGDLYLKILNMKRLIEFSGKSNLKFSLRFCRWMSTYPNANAKVRIWIFDFDFSGNRFKFGIILDDF